MIKLSTLYAQNLKRKRAREKERWAEKMHMVGRKEREKEREG